MLIQKFFLYGCLGLFIEIIFTSLYSLFKKDWSLKAVTYGWMLPIYGMTALVLEAISESLPWPFYAKAFVYVPIIYGAEALSGWVLEKLIGKAPWNYGRSHWTPMGLINLKYAPFWLLLAMAFEPISVYLRKLINFLATIQ